MLLILSNRHYQCHMQVYNADDTALGLLVPEMCDVKIDDELENIIKWSCVNKLQLNIMRTKELVGYFGEATYTWILYQHSLTVLSVWNMLNY